MRRIRTLVAAVVVWGGWTAAAWAQANPLEHVPDSALGFAVIRDLSEANDAVGKLAAKMQLPLPDVLTMIKGFVGVQQGLDDKGGLAVALASGPEGKEWEGSAWYLLVPVTDYGQFIAAFQPDDPDAKIAKINAGGFAMQAASKGSFAVLTWDTTAKADLEKFLAAEKNVLAGIAPLKDWIADKQLAVVVTPAGKSVLFQSIVAALPDQQQLQQDAGAEAPAADALVGVGQMFGQFKELLVEADKQLTHLAIGLRIEDNATLRLAGRALFVPDGDLAKWSKDIKVPAEGLLAGVPGGKFALAYGGVSAQFSPAMQAVLAQFGEMGMQTIGLDKEAQKKYGELTRKLMVGKKFSGGMMGMMRPGDSLFSTAMSIEHVENADAQLQITREMFALMQGAQPDDKGPLYQVNDVKVGELAAIEVITDMSAVAELGGEGAGPAEAQVQGMLSKMFGADGKIHMYVAKATDKVVVTTYGKEQLVHAVQHVQAGGEGLAGDADLAKTAALLPEGAQWVAYVSPQGLVQWIGVFVEAMLGGQTRLPPFPASEPIGLAAKVSATGLDGEIVVPESVVAGLGQYIGAIGQILQGGAPMP